MTTYTRNTLTGSLAPVNNELEKIEVSLREKLDRNPSVGQNNEMLTNIDANGNRIINYPNAVNDSDLITKGQVAGLAPVQTVNGQTGDVQIARNVQIDNGAVFENVAQMKTTSLEVGQLVRTKGYYTPNDGGGAEYLIVATGTGTDDGDNYINLAVNQAELLEGPYQTTSPIELYVSTTGSDTTGRGTVGLPYATVQRAVDSLPRIIANDVVINIADGVYTDVGGQDEFGRGVCVDVSRNLICVKRDISSSFPEKKAKLIFRGASEAGTILDGTDNATTRYVFWVHEVQGVQLENLTCRNSYGGVIVHQNADVTLRDVTTTGCDFGRMIESNSRMEVLRGSNTANTRNYFIKNGQLQENDSTISASIENNFLLDGMAWIHLLRTDLTGTASKNQIDSTGAVWMEFDDCDISGGNNFVVGSYSVMRISNGCRLRDFTSAVWANEAGYTETEGLCHIHNNAFIAFITKGTPVFNLDNADSLNASVVDEPNTNGLRIQGSATSVLIDSDVSVTSSDKVLTRPTSGLIMKGTAPPAVTTTYYERGTMVLNESATTGQPAFWVCTTRGFGGTAVFTAGVNL